ncbi:hypothetical protein AB205_0125640 [Aquarana catesbeiana]|uniref:Uncharacterized protein n=1 Tax=Aquarana catesbeiana TaxID=8400 RepID=A0A2G9SH28_AQUCT|nr:hypothetical protein AB205_0125640 [Aquarana catesbeiana]
MSWKYTCTVNATPEPIQLSEHKYLCVCVYRYLSLEPPFQAGMRSGVAEERSEAAEKKVGSSWEEGREQLRRRSSLEEVRSSSEGGEEQFRSDQEQLRRRSKAAKKEDRNN